MTETMSRRRLQVLTPLALGIAVATLDSPARAASDDLFQRALEKGPLAAALAAFVGGLLTAATPCVYPMIAITVSIFGAREARSRGQAMLLSTCFVLGIVALFTPFLVGAALTGTLFGAQLANRWVIGGVIAIFVALAASMFGAFEMVLPAAVMQRLSSVGGIGYRGAFVLGLATAVIASPCTGPVLTGILLWIGHTRNVALGSIVGAMFAMGLGLPFWLVGAFAVSLPKQGKWMLSVKSFFGVALLVFALRYAKDIVPWLRSSARSDLLSIALYVAFIALGLGLGALHLAWDDSGAFVTVRKTLGIAAATAGAFLLWNAIDAPRKSLIWERSEAVAVARARSDSRPLLIDFTAAWCQACQELAKHTFADERVTQAAIAHKLVALQVDATDLDDPEVDRVRGKYHVVGLPTVLVMDAKGAERARFTAFVGPEAFLTALAEVE
jgi:thiol:disulfide interchange protein DsbD